MSRRRRKNVGLIGLGIIGRRVAENLRKHQFQVFVWNRTPRPVPNFVGSITEVAELCQIIQIFVADDEALQETIQQLSPALTAHHIVLAHCTVSPETMLAAAEAVQRRGARFLDAPFTGSKGAAEKGELIYYVAGDDGALREARPFLEASSKEIVELGDVGEATLLKVATNMVTAATVQSAAEALALVTKYGVVPAKFERALKSNSSQSGTLAMKLPKMIGADFEAHFSVKHMLKDLQIANRLAQSMDLNFRVTEAARDGQLEEMQNGRGDDDYSSVVRKYFPAGMPVPRAPQPEVAMPSESEPAPPATVVAEAALPEVIPPEPAPAEPLPPQPMFVNNPEPKSDPSAIDQEVFSASVENPSGENASAENPPPAEIVAEPARTEEVEPRRGLLGRLFHRGAEH